MNTTTPNPINPKQTVLVEDGSEDGIQVYSIHDNDEEPAATPSPTATSAPEPIHTDVPHPGNRSPKPTTRTRAPELPGP